MMPSYAAVALNVLAESGADGIMWGDAGLLDSVWFRKNGDRPKPPHPLDRWQAVLNALSREAARPEARFEAGLIRLGGRRVRVFHVVRQAYDDKPSHLTHLNRAEIWLRPQEQ